MLCRKIPYDLDLRRVREHMPQECPVKRDSKASFAFWHIRQLRTNISHHRFPVFSALWMKLKFHGKQWGNPQHRHQLGLHLQIANTFRNRVAHHEPLFKFRYQGAYPKKLAIGLNNLRGCMDHCLAISGWIDSGAEQALRQSDWFQHFQVLSTEACFNDWIRDGQPPVHSYFV